MSSVDNIKYHNWETVGVIGRGTFGTVYEIQRDIFGDVEKAALKVIRIPQNNSDIDELYSDGYDEESISAICENHLRSIVSEYSFMRKVKNNSNIVHCDDVYYVEHTDEIGWDVYIKMELLTPIAKRQGEVYSDETVIKLALDMCSALRECEKHGIVHRDIKPQNIFISEYGTYKLGDFGIAKTVEKTMGGTKVGTYKYMAPEVYYSKPYGKQADIYSLGLVLYWMMNERRMPFMPLPPEKPRAGAEEESRARRFAGEQLPPPKNGSDKLKTIVLKACAFDPKDRFANAQEMLDALNALRYGGTVVCVQSVEHSMPVEHKPAAAVEAPVAKTKEKKSDTVRTYGSAERGYLVNIMKEFADKPWLSITNNGKTATFHSANLYWREIAAAVNKINKAIGCDEWTYEKMSVCDGDAANGFLADNGKIYVNWKKEPENRLRLIVTYKLINLW